MSDWPWASPDGTRMAITQTIRDRYPQNERQRRLVEMSYRRLLARLFTAHPENWVVKGGVALLMRLDPSRTSNDIDITHIANAGHDEALEALRRDAALDLGDFFSFEIGDGQVVDPDHPTERALSVHVVARIGSQVVGEFNIDLALPQGDLEVEWINAARPLTGNERADQAPDIAVLPITAQLADKACAIFERRGVEDRFSSRVRDLADIGMIAFQVDDISGDELRAALRSQEDRRLASGSLREPLPQSLVLPDDQAADWEKRWERATRGAPISYEDALQVAQRLLDPVLADRVIGARWSRSERAWLLG